MPKIIILTSGLSCTGKTTWRKALKAELTKNNIGVTVASADELTIRYCQEKNRSESLQLSYSDMFVPPYQASCIQTTEKQFAEIIEQSDDDVIILDRTHLSRSFRQELMQKFADEHVVVVFFKVADEVAHQARLTERNRESELIADPAQRTIIRDDVIARQKARLQEPTEDEGMAKLIQITDVTWDEDLQSSVDEMVQYIQQQVSRFTPQHS